MTTATRPVEAEFITITEAARRFAPEDTDEARRLMRFKIENYVWRRRLTDTMKDGTGLGPGGEVKVNPVEVKYLLDNPPKRGPKPRAR